VRVFFYFLGMMTSPETVPYSTAAWKGTWSGGGVRLPEGRTHSPVGKADRGPTPEQPRMGSFAEGAEKTMRRMGGLTWMWAVGWSWVGMGILLLGGCRESRPPMIPVSGKVTYENGDLAPANRMELRFLTPEHLVREKHYPPAAVARVDTRNGEFSEATTWEHGDGVIEGEHEVELIRVGDEADPGAFRPKEYRGKQIWPNPVRVSPESREFHFTIPRD